MRTILVSELTRLDREVMKEGTEDSVRRNYEAPTFDADLKAPDVMYKAELAKVRQCLHRQRANIVDCLRHEAQSFIFRADDVIVILGDDGAFVNIAKLLQDQMVITVATATKHCGRLMKFTTSTFEAHAPNLFTGKSAFTRVSIARAETSLGHTCEAVNDFYVGRADLRSSRYAILRDTFADQVSSGVIISTGTGSTGWEKSARATDRNYEERELCDETLNVYTRELCHGTNFGVISGTDEITFRSNDNDTRIIADGVLLDAAMLLLPAGATVTICANVRSVKLCT